MDSIYLLYLLSILLFFFMIPQNIYIYIYPCEFVTDKGLYDSISSVTTMYVNA